MHAVALKTQTRFDLKHGHVALDFENAYHTSDKWLFYALWFLGIHTCAYLELTILICQPKSAKPDRPQTSEIVQRARSGVISEWCYDVCTTGNWPSKKTQTGAQSSNLREHGAKTRFSDRCLQATLQYGVNFYLSLYSPDKLMGCKHLPSSYCFFTFTLCT